MLTLFIILFLCACVQDWWVTKRKNKRKPPELCILLMVPETHQGIINLCIILMILMAIACVFMWQEGNRKDKEGADRDDVC